MFENESAAVRAGIGFLQAMTENEYLLDPTFDVLDLERKLNEIQADVNRLISNLPVEAIDDDEEREQEYTSDSTRVISRIARNLKTRWSSAKS